MEILAAADAAAVDVRVSCSETDSAADVGCCCVADY